MHLMLQSYQIGESTLKLYYRVKLDTSVLTSWKILGLIIMNVLILLLAEITDLMLREPAEKIDDFYHVKAKLLERTNPEIYRQKFT